jgi:hypothetical protein
MKITTKKIIDILVNEYYYDRELLETDESAKDLIKHTRNVINDILKYHKGINIKGK